MQGSGKLTGALAILALFCAPAAAQQTYCLRNGQVDQQTSQQLQQMLNRPNQQIAQALAGTWYAEIRSPSTSQIVYSYVTYEPNGLWGYQNRVCGGMTNYCSDYQGTGLYAGVPLATGQISLIIMYSDTQTDHACIGSVVQVGNGTLQDSNGTTWQRVR